MALPNSMISNAVITGGVFNLINNEHGVGCSHNGAPAQIPKGPLDRLLDNVSHAAFHDSGKRYDPPRCHPNTRVSIREKLDHWALRLDPNSMKASIMWLTGAAGAGKSAIAQTMAESFASQHRLAASFFFGKSDPSRNTIRPFVATLAYQLYRAVSTPSKDRILAAVNDDPLIFTKSITAQFEQLIINPLQTLFHDGHFDSPDSARLIIVDGLDECLERDQQVLILDLVQKAVQTLRAPFLFLVASRPEGNIQTFFDSPQIMAVCTRLVLDWHMSPERDIEVFLRDRFAECRMTHPQRRFIPVGWPSDDDIKSLVRKSSGHFIYASVVVKYVTSIRHQPYRRLQIILNIRPQGSDQPFEELDALYGAIFSSVDNVELVLHVIAANILFSFPKEDRMELLLGLEPGDMSCLLSDLTSVIGIQSVTLGGTPRALRILHASLTDYLYDPKRSVSYFIDLEKHANMLVVTCLGIMRQPTFYFEPVFHDAMRFITSNKRMIRPSPGLLNAVEQLSISHIYKRKCRPLQETPINFDEFLPSFLELLLTLGSDYIDVHNKLSRQYGNFVKAEIAASGPALSFACVLATMDGTFDRLRIISWKSPLCLIDYDTDLTVFGPIALLMSIHSPSWDRTLTLHSPAISLLREQLYSMPWSIGVESMYAEAAVYCLGYLTDHLSVRCKAPSPDHFPEQRQKRIYRPWRWRKGNGGIFMRSWWSSPWPWLFDFDDKDDVNLEFFCVGYTPHSRRNDIIYADSSRVAGYAFPHILKCYQENPLLWCRINSEKYRLGLSYLLLLLPKAGNSADLLHMCRTKMLSTMSWEFPNRSRKVRHAMVEYVRRWTE